MEFGFKGERSYIQGPDLVNGVLSHFAGKEIQNVKFSIHGFINTPHCTLSIYAADPKNNTGEFRGYLTRDGKKWWLEITARDQKSGVENRSPYDENAIISQCNIEGKQVSLTGRSAYSFMETIVSMTKLLLTELIRPTGGKWIFTAIEIDEYFDLRENLSIKLLHNFQNKLVKSEVLSDDVRVGIIYFSLVKP
jgi:hypothetical protein